MNKQEIACIRDTKKRLDASRGIHESLTLAFDKAKEPAQRDYEKAVRHARIARDKAVAPAEKAYDKAMTDARTTYRSVVGF